MQHLFIQTDVGLNCRLLLFKNVDLVDRQYYNMRTLGLTTFFDTNPSPFLANCRRLLISEGCAIDIGEFANYELIQQKYPFSGQSKNLLYTLK